MATKKAKKETKLRLCFLDEKQYYEIISKPKYTAKEIDQLLMLAFTINKLTKISTNYLQYKPDDETGEGLIFIFDTIKLLIQPITTFLDDGNRL